MMSMLSLQQGTHIRVSKKSGQRDVTKIGLCSVQTKNVTMKGTHLSRLDRDLIKLMAAQPEPRTTTLGLAVNLPPLP